jgi:hypothetical protein
VSVAVCPLPPTQPDRKKFQRLYCNERKKKKTVSLLRDSTIQLFLVRFVFDVGLFFSFVCRSDAILIHYVSSNRLFILCEVVVDWKV